MCDITTDGIIVDHSLAGTSYPENTESRKPKRRCGNHSVAVECTEKHSDRISVYVIPKGLIVKKTMDQRRLSM